MAKTILARSRSQPGGLLHEALVYDDETFVGRVATFLREGVDEDPTFAVLNPRHQALLRPSLTPIGGVLVSPVGVRIERGRNVPDCRRAGGAALQTGLHDDDERTVVVEDVLADPVVEAAGRVKP